jgi:hypothetical protein
MAKAHQPAQSSSGPKQFPHTRARPKISVRPTTTPAAWDRRFRDRTIIIPRAIYINITLPQTLLASTADPPGHPAPTLTQAHTRPETICPGTSKLACWQVQLSTASKVGRRGAGTATASTNGTIYAGGRVMSIPA